MKKIKISVLLTTISAVAMWFVLHTSQAKPFEGNNEVVTYYDFGAAKCACVTVTMPDGTREKSCSDARSQSCLCNYRCGRL